MMAVCATCATRRIHTPNMHAIGWTEQPDGTYRCAFCPAPQRTEPVGLSDEVRHYIDERIRDVLLHHGIGSAY